MRSHRFVWECLEGGWEGSVAYREGRAERDKGRKRAMERRGMVGRVVAIVSGKVCRCWYGQMPVAGR